ncbi:hypothetical protein [Streptomyces sp. NPDC059994]|uniref:hypothetical protein n=1 Tax=Streptomyces sp. NPDC059994 TaxID=3347029 RepID=UPI0036B8433A
MRNQLTAAAGISVVLVLAGVTGCSAQQAKDTATSAADAAAQANKAVMAAFARTSDKAQGFTSAEVTMTVSGKDQTKPLTMTGTYTWGREHSYDALVNTDSMGMGKLTSRKTMRMLNTHGAYFYQIDPQPTGPFKGKHWMKVDASAILGDKGAAGLRSADADPTAGLKSLKYASDATDLGTETVQGKQARHYRAVIEADRLGAAGNALTGKDGAPSALNDFTGTVHEVTLGVWVDPRTDLPVRWEQTMGAAKVTMEFGAFGHATTVTVPSASDTADITQAVKDEQAKRTG